MKNWEWNHWRWTTPRSPWNMLKRRNRKISRSKSSCFVRHTNKWWCLHRTILYVQTKCGQNCMAHGKHTSTEWLAHVSAMTTFAKQWNLVIGHYYIMRTHKGRRLSNLAEISTYLDSFKCQSVLDEGLRDLYDHNFVLIHDRDPCHWSVSTRKNKENLLFCNVSWQTLKKI